MLVHKLTEPAKQGDAATVRGESRTRAMTAWGASGPPLCICLLSPCCARIWCAIGSAGSAGAAGALFLI